MQVGEEFEWGWPECFIQLRIDRSYFFLSYKETDTYNPIQLPFTELHEEARGKEEAGEEQKRKGTESVIVLRLYLTVALETECVRVRILVGDGNDGRERCWRRLRRFCYGSHCLR
jgi:hypothetical protein